MDFKTYTGKTEAGLINGDLLLDSAMHDLAADDSELGPVMAAIRELFEMSPADDLSHPELYSGQRAYQNSEGAMAELERIQDATNLLKSIPEIDPSSIEIAVVDDLLDVRFKVKSGAQGAMQL